MPGTVLTAFVLLHVHLTSALAGGYGFYPHLSGPGRLSHLPELTWLASQAAWLRGPCPYLLCQEALGESRHYGDAKPFLQVVPCV